VQTAEGQSLGELRRVIALAGLHLYELALHLPIAAVEISANGFLLGFQAETGLALLSSGNSEVSYKFAISHLDLLVFRLQQRSLWQM
jgi:hypothetical protein